MAKRGRPKKGSELKNKKRGFHLLISTRDKIRRLSDLGDVTRPYVINYALEVLQEDDVETLKAKLNTFRNVPRGKSKSVVYSLSPALRGRLADFKHITKVDSELVNFAIWLLPENQ